MKMIWCSLLALALALLPAAARAGGPAPGDSPRQILVRYLAAVNAHRAYAAWQLEASCSVTFTISNGPGAPKGSEGWRGRAPWVRPRNVQLHHPIVAAVHVKKIRRLHVPILARHHILAFGVRGWFRFDYSAVPWANDKHRSGFHVAKIAIWRCNGRWGVDPTWAIAGGGELNWS